MRNFIIAILLLVSPCLYAQNQPTFEQAWQAAQNGDANAYYWLGCFYYQGEGTKQNYTEALKYFQKAANNGDAYSYAWIAKIYYYGNGCAQNYEEAFKWFLKAANAGQTVVYGWLGSVYYEGKGCNKIMVKLSNGLKSSRKRRYTSICWPRSKLHAAKTILRSITMVKESC